MSNSDPIRALIEDMAGKTKNADRAEAPMTLTERRKSARRTMELARRMLAKPDQPFKQGDLIQWKPGLSNRKHPGPNQPVVILEVLDEPLFDESEGCGSGYFREPLDIVVGCLMSDGALVGFHADSRRFEHYREDADSDQPEH